MSDELSMTVSGIPDVKAALNAFAADLRRYVVRQALRSAAEPIVIAARNNAPTLATATRRRVPGTLKRNINVFNSKKSNGQGGVLGVFVSVRASRQDLKKSPITGDPYYWRWVEGGHRIVPRSRRVGTYRGKAKYAQTLRVRRSASSGFVAARGFLLAAFRSQSVVAVRIFSAQILAHIAKANGAK